MPKSNPGRSENMSSCLLRPLVQNLRSKLVLGAACSKRYIMEVRPEDYGNYPGSFDESNPANMLSRSLADKRYETQVFPRRQFDGSPSNPIVIASAADKRMVGCACEQDSQHLVFMWLVKGEPKQCECGYWMELVNADSESVPDMYDFGEQRDEIQEETDADLENTSTAKKIQ